MNNMKVAKKIAKHVAMKVLDDRRILRLTVNPTRNKKWNARLELGQIQHRMSPTLIIRGVELASC